MKILTSTMTVALLFVCAVTAASVPTPEQRLCQAAEGLNLAAPSSTVSAAPNSPLMKYYMSVNEEVYRAVARECKDKKADYYQILAKAVKTCTSECDGKARSLSNGGPVSKECKSTCEVRHISTLNFYDGYQQGLIAGRSEGAKNKTEQR